MLAWIRRLFGWGTAKLTDYELIVLNAVSSRLDSLSEARLLARISSINLVQRIDGGREVNCYQILKGKPYFDASTRLREEDGEHLLADFRIHGPSGVKNSGKVWLVNGFFFSIEFQDPTEHANSRDVVGIDVHLK